MVFMRGEIGLKAAKGKGGYSVESIKDIEQNLSQRVRSPASSKSLSKDGGEKPASQKNPTHSAIPPPF
jgi:hypothetical protein